MIWMSLNTVNVLISVLLGSKSVLLKAFSKLTLKSKNATLSLMTDM